MRPIIALALKDLRLMVRDKFGLFWLLIFPLLMALFFGSIFSGSSSGGAAMKIALVDLAQSDFSRAFVDHLDSSASVRVIRTVPDSARALVRRGKAVAFLIIQPGFGEWEDMFSSDKSAGLIAGVDPTRQAEAGYLQGLVMEAYFAQLQSMFSDPATAQEQITASLADLAADTTLQPDQRKALTELLGGLDLFLGQVDDGLLDSGDADGTSRPGLSLAPKIQVEEVTPVSTGPRSAWEITFPQAVLWALVGCTAAFAITIVTERTRGTLLRLRIAPISRGHILAGKALSCFITAVSVCILLLLIGKFVFGVRTPNPLALGLAIACTAICFVGLMMLMSVMGKSEQAVGGAGWAILLVFSMTGGGMVPLMVMPGWMVSISHISPVKWGIFALEGAIWRGFTLQEMALPLSILTLVGLVTFSLGVVIFRKST